MRPAVFFAENATRYHHLPANWELLDGCILHQIPHAAGTGAGTEPASDAFFSIHLVRKLAFAFGNPDDGGFRTHGHTNAAVPALTAGRTLTAAVAQIVILQNAGVIVRQADAFKIDDAACVGGVR